MASVKQLNHFRHIICCCVDILFQLEKKKTVRPSYSAGNKQKVAFLGFYQQRHLLSALLLAQQMWTMCLHKRLNNFLWLHTVCDDIIGGKWGFFFFWALNREGRIWATIPVRYQHWHFIESLSQQLPRLNMEQHYNIYSLALSMKYPESKISQLLLS